MVIHTGNMPSIPQTCNLAMHVNFQYSTSQESTWPGRPSGIASTHHLKKVQCCCNDSLTKSRPMLRTRQDPGSPCL